VCGKQKPLLQNGSSWHEHQLQSPETSKNDSDTNQMKADATCRGAPTQTLRRSPKPQLDAVARGALRFGVLRAHEDRVMSRVWMLQAPTRMRQLEREITQNEGWGNSGRRRRRRRRTPGSLSAAAPDLKQPPGVHFTLGILLTRQDSSSGSRLPPGLHMKACM
jgi:hypothetical protein